MRNIVIKVYVTSSEKHHLNELAAASRIPLSILARTFLLGRNFVAPPPVVPAINRAAYIELSKLAFSLNEISCYLTGDSSLDFVADDLSRALVATQQCIKALRATLIGSNL